MLVLSRRAGEKIAIGNDVVVEILSAADGSVRIGISAPRETPVHRFEVYAMIEAANRAAEFTASNMEENVLEDLATRIIANSQNAQKNLQEL